MNHVKILLGLPILLFNLLSVAMDTSKEDYYFRGHKLLQKDLVIDRSMGKEDVSPFFVLGELVIVSQESDSWTLAKVTEKRPFNRYQVNLLKNGSHMILDQSSMAVLKPIWHCIYQPTVSLAMFDEILDIYLKKIESKETPFVQSSILKPEKKVIVVGDLHGSFSSLAHHMQDWYKKGIISEKLKLHPDYTLVCTGDYVDRGPDGVEILYVLMNLKLANPNSVFLIRGNHESENVFRDSDFKNEWLAKFGKNQFSLAVLNDLSLLFKTMPHAVILGRTSGNLYDCIMFSHGGVENVQHLLGHVIEKHACSPLSGIITHPLQDLSVDNDFNWMDFYATGSRNPHLMCKSERGGDGLMWSWALFNVCLQRCFTTLDETAPYRYQLRALFRGHQHMEGGITQLLERSLEDGVSWKKLEDGHDYPVDMRSVYTFISSPEALPKEWAKHDAYGIISIRNDAWILTTHIKERILASISDD